MFYLLEHASIHGLGEGGVGHDGGLLLDDADVVRSDGQGQGDQEKDKHLDEDCDDSVFRLTRSRSGQPFIPSAALGPMRRGAIFTQFPNRSVNPII